MTRPALALLILSFALALFASPARATDNFAPCASTQPASTAPDAPSDITTTFAVNLTGTCAPFTFPFPPAYMAQDIVLFTPPEWTVAHDSDIVDGTPLGTFTSKVLVGILNNGCNTIINIPFDLYEATTNRANPQWPSYLDAIGQRQGMNLDQLIARYVGINSGTVSGVTITVNFLVFAPGAQISNQFQADPALGYPTVGIFPFRAVSDKDALSDFCAPFWAEQTLFGELGDAVFRGNPPDGTYDFTTFLTPQPDEDNDGVENALDPCPLTPNASGWDPRASSLQNPGDQDGDGLPDDCDPNPIEKSECSSHVGISNSDEDCDGWQNRGDNCPLVVNTDQADTDLDSIGDSCDPDPAHAPPPHGVCLVNQLVIGAGGPAPPDPQTLLPCTPDFVMTGDVDCDHDVDRRDLLAWLKDQAGVAPVPCPEAIPPGCTDPHADRRFVILQFLRHLINPNVGIPPCPVP